LNGTEIIIWFEKSYVEQIDISREFNLLFLALINQCFWFLQAISKKDFGTESKHIRVKPAGILEYVEDFQVGLTQSSGQKTFLRWLVESA
jgi:hypothetical protein